MPIMHGCQRPEINEASSFLGCGYSLLRYEFLVSTPTVFIKVRPSLIQEEATVETETARLLDYE